MEEKKSLRQKMKKALSDIDPELRGAWIKEIHSRLFHSESWQNASVIAVTISQGFELDTRDIIRQGWQENKTVVVPKCVPKDKRLQFRAIHTFAELETVYYGLLEPIESETASVEKENIDLIIVPGLIFDRGGYRIGFGDGYYDRFLKGIRAVKLAQAFDIQLMEDMPHEEHDIPVDYILTPFETITCQEGRNKR